MPQVDFTLEDLKQVFDERLNERLTERFMAEREYTRQLVREEVGAQFTRFLEDNFEPFMNYAEERFDGLEDRLDRLTGDVAKLRVDMRHVKQVLRPPEPWRAF